MDRSVYSCIIVFKDVVVLILIFSELFNTFLQISAPTLVFVFCVTLKEINNSRWVL